MKAARVIRYDEPLPPPQIPHYIPPQPRRRVVELFTPDYVYGCFWAIASQRDLDYYYLVDSGIDRDSPRLDDLMHPCYRDIYVDISRLQKFLGN